MLCVVMLCVIMLGFASLLLCWVSLYRLSWRPSVVQIQPHYLKTIQLNALSITQQRWPRVEHFKARNPWIGTLLSPDLSRYNQTRPKTFFQAQTLQLILPPFSDEKKSFMTLKPGQVELMDEIRSNRATWDRRDLWGKKI